MKAINLDKFSPKVKVAIDGEKYELRLYSVGDYIAGRMDEFNSGKTEDQKSSMKNIVRFIKEYSNIPEETLMTFGMNMLTALSTIIQGGEIDGTEDGGQGNG